jgi:glutamate:Na+ symporter, ESS family
MSLSAWFSVVLAIPVLLLGELVVRRTPLLLRFNIPAPVAGGLLVSLLILLGNVSGLWPVHWETKVAARWWTWLVTTEIEWAGAPAKNVNLPFLVGFFTCIGLNASWSLARRGSMQVLLFLLLSGGLALLQNVVGVGIAKLLGVSPLLGLICGSVSMTGGHGTALGFAPDLQQAGLESAAVVGVAAATFGLVAGGLLGGPIGGGLIRRRNLRPAVLRDTHLPAGVTGPSGILTDLGALVMYGPAFLLHVGLLLVCIKVGAWASFFIQQTGITFPVYIGAMLLGVMVRNAVELSGGRWMRTEIIDTLGSIMLGIFLSIALMSLNLLELANTALPMLVILSVQIIIMALYARYITFHVMGRDFDAAVMAGGHCGFGLGATPNAVANMKALVESFGPAPRAFLVLPIVGAFLIDFVNALNITTFLNLFKP